MEWQAFRIPAIVTAHGVATLTPYSECDQFPHKLTNPKSKCPHDNPFLAFQKRNWVRQSLRIDPNLDALIVLTADQHPTDGYFAFPTSTRTVKTHGIAVQPLLLRATPLECFTAVPTYQLSRWFELAGHYAT